MGLYMRCRLGECYLLETGRLSREMIARTLSQVAMVVGKGFTEKDQPRTAQVHHRSGCYCSKNGNTISFSSLLCAHDLAAPRWECIRRVRPESELYRHDFITFAPGPLTSYHYPLEHSTRFTYNCCRYGNISCVCLSLIFGFTPFPLSPP